MCFHQKFRQSANEIRKKGLEAGGDAVDEEDNQSSSSTIKYPLENGEESMVSISSSIILKVLP